LRDEELAHVEDKERLTAASNVLNACASLSRDDRLLVLQLVWLLSAQRARSAALAVPGEFQREQARQLNQLEKMSVLVKKDTPDLELDRLLREGDEERALQYLRDHLEKSTE
jgi:hypothetical protein